MFPRIASLIIGYVFGIFQTAYFYVKMNGIDIREHGSGNAGTTNALRVLGKKAGVVVFLGDFLKCFLAVCLVKAIFGEMLPDSKFLVGLYGATGCILGHNFPIQLKFRGGKGIASTAGMLAALDPRIAIAVVLTFLLIVILTRYVSLGSIVIVCEFAILLFMFGQRGDYGLSQAALIEVYILGAFLAVMAIWRHRANIVRLLNGTENKIFSKK